MSKENKDKYIFWKIALRHLFLISLWFFAFVKIFVFDIDTYVVTKVFNISQAVYSYKIIVCIILVYLLARSFKNYKFWFALGYILMYPFFLVFWHIPKTLLTKRYHFILIYYADNLINLILQFERLLIILFVFVSGFTLINLVNVKWLNIVGISILLVFYVNIFVQKILQFRKPLRIFAVNLDKFSSSLATDPHSARVARRVKSLKDKEEKKKKAEEAEKKKKEREEKNESSTYFGVDIDKTSPIETPVFKMPKVGHVLMAETLYWFQDLINTFEKKKLYLVYYFIQTLLSIALAFFIIVEITYGFYKVNPEWFTIETGHSIASSIILHVLHNLTGIDTISVMYNSDWLLWFKLFYIATIYTLTVLIFAYWKETTSKMFIQNVSKIKQVVEYRIGRVEKYIQLKYNVPAPTLFDLLKTNDNVLAFFEKFFRTSVRRTVAKKAVILSKKDKKPFAVGVKTDKRKDKQKKGKPLGKKQNNPHKPGKRKK